MSQMKDLFPSYCPSQKEFKEIWQSAIFILDTNVLLNLYRYSEETRKQFFSVLEKLSDQLWIPYQVALEFQDNRIRVVQQTKKTFSGYNSFLKNLNKSLNNLKSDESIKDSLKYYSSIDSKARIGI
ncbi:PIN domain-containing protein [Roseofilum reptotaenium CS-1145]|nr:PIN domain-containing protein [Roseofilum reptotaenium CS-1145]